MRIWRSCGAAIDWGKMENQLLRVQQRLPAPHIAGTARRDRAAKSSSSAHFRPRSWRCAHVVQINSEAGVDGVRWQTDAEKMRAACR